VRVSAERTAYDRAYEREAREGANAQEPIETHGSAYEREERGKRISTHEGG